MWPRKKRKEDNSIKALEEAQQSLEAVRARSSEVTATSKASIELARRNHFVEHLEAIMGGSR
jgi:hypothetical protein